MKGFNRLAFIGILFGIFYYLGWVDEDTTQQAPAPPPPQTAQTAAPQAVPEQVFPPSAADSLLPSWPPQEGPGTNTIADLLTRKNLVMILDGSGSMAKQGCSGERSKNEVAREAVLEWASSVPEDANLGLVVFDKKGFSIRLPLGLDNRDRFMAEVEQVEPYNKTPLTIALKTAYGMLTEQGRRQLGYGDYTVVIVTDGVADDIKALENSVNMVLSQSPVMIHTIGFCIDENHTLNRQGRTVYRAANNLDELRSGLQEVLAESESFDITGFE